MEKLYVFTLDFTAAEDAYSFYIRSQNNPENSSHSQKDILGFSEFFHTEQIFSHNGERLEITCFTRSFCKKFQVVRAAYGGCQDIARFFNLIAELKSQENIQVICRIIIHGNVGPASFEMEEVCDRVTRRSPVRIDTVAKIIANSIPPHGAKLFTLFSPLTIHLISCSAGSSVDYLQMGRNSLAGRLAFCLGNRNIFSQIHAPTTKTVIQIGYTHLMRNKSVITLPHDRKSFIHIFGEYYRRRGVPRALKHIEDHIASKEDREIFEQVKKFFVATANNLGNLTLFKVLRERKIGYHLLYTLNSDHSVCVKDYATGSDFASADDIKFESNREILLEYLWVELLYAQCASIHSKFLSYGLPIPVAELFGFIEQIENARNRAEILQILSIFEKNFHEQIRLSYKLHFIFGKIINALSFNTFEACHITRYTPDLLKKEFSNPATQFFQRT